MGFSPGFLRGVVRAWAWAGVGAGASLFLAASSLEAAPADRIDLKDGTHLDGHFLYAEEKPDAFVFNVAPVRGAVERREVPKAAVASVAYGDGTDDPAFLLLPPPDSQPEVWYAERLRRDLDPWLAQYPKSSHLAEMQARRAAFEAERQRVAAGDVRHGARWLGAGEAADWAPELAAQSLLPAIGEAGRQADAVRLQSLLPQAAAVAAAPSAPALARAAVPALDACLATLQPGSYADGLKRKLAFYQSEEERCALEIQSVINQKVQGYPIRPGNSDSYTKVGDLWYQNGSYVPPYGEFGAYYDLEIASGGVAVALSEDTLTALRGWLRQIADAKAEVARVEADLRDSDAGLKKLSDLFHQARARFAAEPVDKEEAVVAAVRGAGDRIDAGDWAGAEPILAQANKDWPGNLAVPLAVTDKAAAFQARIDAAIKAGKIAESQALQGQAARMLPYLLPKSERARQIADSLKDGPARLAQALVDHLRATLRQRPFAEFLQERAALLQTVQHLRQAKADAAAGEIEKRLAALEKDGGIEDALAAQASFDQRDFAAVLAAVTRLDAEGTPDGVRAWLRDLRARAQAQIDDSDAQLARVNRLLLRLDFARAHAALGHAAEIWPGNPAIDARTHFFQGAVGLAGAVALSVGLVVLLAAWNALSTVTERFRYKEARKKHARPARKPRRSPPPSAPPAP